MQLSGPAIKCSGRDDSPKSSHNYLVKPLSLRDGQLGWAKSGFTVISRYKRASYFSYALAILKPDFPFLSSQRGPDFITIKTSRKSPAGLTS